MTKAECEIRKHGKYLSAAKIRSIEQGIAGRVPVRIFRAWLATRLKATQTGTASGKGETRHQTRDPRDQPTRQLGTGLARRSTMQKGHEEPGVARMGTMVEMVRRHAQKRTSGAVAGARLTPPMIADIKDSLNKRGVKAIEVETALVIMASEGEAHLTTHERASGSAGSGIVYRAVGWATTASWMTEGRARAMGVEAQERVVNNPETMVIFDWGEGYGGAKEGFQRECTTYGVDKARHQKGAKEGMTTPDMQFDFRSGKEDLVGFTQRKARVSTDVTIGGHISPACNTHSLIQGLEATNGNGRGRGTNAGKEEDPAEKETIRLMVASITRKTRDTPAWSYTVEQPRGSDLGTNPDMRTLGTPVEVRMCSYGYDWSKPTWVWTNLYPKYWTPRAFDSCQYCKTRTRHPRTVLRQNADDKRPKPFIPGFTLEAARNRIHPDLAQEWARAMIARWQDLRT